MINNPLRISSVNVTKSSRNHGFGHIYWRNPQWKTSFFVQCDNKSLKNVYCIPKNSAKFKFLIASAVFWLKIFSETATLVAILNHFMSLVSFYTV